MNPNNQVIQPDNQSQNNNQYSPSQVPQPPQPLQNYTPSNDFQNNNNSDEKRKKLLLFGGIGLGAIFLLTITAAVFYSIGASNAPEPEPPITQTIENDGPQPASSLDVQIINNSIGSTLSEVSNEADFPLDDLSDDELGL